MSYEAKLTAPHWSEVRKRDILTAAHPFTVYRGFQIIKLEGNPPKWYAERGKIKTALRNTINEVYTDLQTLAVRP